MSILQLWGMVEVLSNSFAVVNLSNQIFFRFVFLELHNHINKISMWILSQPKFKFSSNENEWPVSCSYLLLYSVCRLHSLDVVQKQVFFSHSKHARMQIWLSLHRICILLVTLLCCILKRLLSLFYFHGFGRIIHEVLLWTSRKSPKLPLTVESFVKFKLALLGQVQGLAKLLNQMKIWQTLWDT